MAGKLVGVGIDQLFAKGALERKIPEGCTKCFKVDYYEPYFQVSYEEVKRRLKMSLKPVGGDKLFYDRIIHNPDLYGPFWLIITWWLFLFIGMAFESLLKSKGKEMNVDIAKF